MPKLILRFGERELQECPVGARPVTIGRLPDNVLVIDNPAVSGRHARVVQQGGQFVLEDLKSTNGTFVNDKPIARHTLLEGDVVIVGKHSLVFTMAGSGQPQSADGTDAVVPEMGGTRILDTMRQKSLLDALDQARAPRAHSATAETAIAAPPARAGTVRVISGKTDRVEYALAAATTIIGKTDTAQIKTAGWFKPEVSAAITRNGDGFVVSPIGASVTVNGQKIAGRQALQPGDLIAVSGLVLEFTLV